MDAVIVVGIVVHRWMQRAWCFSHIYHGLWIPVCARSLVALKEKKVGKIWENWQYHYFFLRYKTHFGSLWREKKMREGILYQKLWKMWDLFKQYSMLSNTRESFLFPVFHSWFYPLSLEYAEKSKKKKKRTVPVF